MTIFKQPMNMIRIISLFIIFYLGFGLAMPYISLWFKSRGVTDAEIGFAWAIFMVSRTIGAFGWALWVDRLSNLRPALFFSALGSVIIFSLLTLELPSLFIVLFWGACGAFYPVKIPLIDSLATRISQKDGAWSFGVIRGWGSVAFMIANIVGGVLISYYTNTIILPFMIAITALTLCNILLLPAKSYRIEVETSTERPKLKEILGYLSGSNPFLIMLIISALLQGSHGFYYSMSSIAWSDQGLNSVVIGVLLSVGVVAETIFFFFSDRIIKRVGIINLILISGVLSIIRWLGLAFTPDLATLFVLQIFHAFTFATPYVIFIYYIRMNIPQIYQTSALGINIALSNGFALAISTAFSGTLYSHYGSYGYILMAVIGGTSLLLIPYLLRENKPIKK